MSLSRRVLAARDDHAVALDLEHAHALAGRDQLAARDHVHAPALDARHAGRTAVGLDRAFLADQREVALVERGLAREGESAGHHAPTEGALREQLEAEDD